MTMKILGIAGSLRQDSFNRQLLSKMSARSPEGTRFQLVDSLADVPLFNEDLEEPAAPAGVIRLWRKVRDADVLVFATPEYNQSLPGVMKNAVDWMSRDPDRGLRGKPCAVTGATIGRWGTRIAQQQLRTVLATCGARPLADPALFVADGVGAGPSDQDVDAFLGAIIAECSIARLAAQLV
jgi:chromate reductase